MSIAENKALIHKAIENWNNPTKRDEYFDLYDENVAIHGFPPGLPPGVAGLKLFYSGLWTAFADSKVTIEDLIAEGDKLSARYTFSGTHQAEFMGIAATGTQVTMAGITMFNISNGKCVERWNQGDLLGLMQQIGVIPG